MAASEFATLFSLNWDLYSLINAMVLDAARDGVPIDPVAIVKTVFGIYPDLTLPAADLRNEIVRAATSVGVAIKGGGGGA